MLFHAFFLFVVITSYAQQGSSVINLQLGIGGSAGGATVQTPALYGNYEYFVADNLSIGGMLGYTTLAVDSYDIGGGGDVTEKTSNIVVGGLANYYFVNGDDLDVYAGVKLGYANELVGSIFYDTNLGAKYFLSDAVGLNAEVGFGLSLLKLGVTINL